MDALKMLKEKNRLTDNCRINCCNCRLSLNHNGTNFTCRELITERPETFIDIISRWSSECPKITYKDVVLKAFPNARYDDTASFPFCPADIGLKDIRECGLDGGASCVKCWSQEYAEER